MVNVRSPPLRAITTMQNVVSSLSSPRGGAVSPPCCPAAAAHRGPRLCARPLSPLQAPGHWVASPRTCTQHLLTPRSIALSAAVLLGPPPALSAAAAAGVDNDNIASATESEAAVLHRALVKALEDTPYAHLLVAVGRCAPTSSSTSAGDLVDCLQWILEELSAETMTSQIQHASVISCVGRLAAHLDATAAGSGAWRVLQTAGPLLQRPLPDGLWQHARDMITHRALAYWDYEPLYWALGLQQQQQQQQQQEDGSIPSEAIQRRVLQHLASSLKAAAPSQPRGDTASHLTRVRGVLEQLAARDPTLLDNTSLADALLEAHVQVKAFDQMSALAAKHWRLQEALVVAAAARKAPQLLQLVEGLTEGGSLSRLSEEALQRVHNAFMDMGHSQACLQVAGVVAAAAPGHPFLAQLPLLLLGLLQHRRLQTRKRGAAANVAAAAAAAAGAGAGGGGSSGWSVSSPPSAAAAAAAGSTVGFTDIREWLEKVLLVLPPARAHQLLTGLLQHSKGQLGSNQAWQLYLLLRKRQQLVTWQAQPQLLMLPVAAADTLMQQPRQPGWAEAAAAKVLTIWSHLSGIPVATSPASSTSSGGGAGLSRKRSRSPLPSTAGSNTDQTRSSSRSSSRSRSRRSSSSGRSDVSTSSATAAVDVGSTQQQQQRCVVVHLSKEAQVRLVAALARCEQHQELLQLVQAAPHLLEHVLQVWQVQLRGAQQQQQQQQLEMDVPDLYASARSSCGPSHVSQPCLHPLGATVAAEASSGPGSAGAVPAGGGAGMLGRGALPEQMATPAGTNSGSGTNRTVRLTQEQHLGDEKLARIMAWCPTVDQAFDQDHNSLGHQQQLQAAEGAKPISGPAAAEWAEEDQEVSTHLKVQGQPPGTTELQQLWAWMLSQQQAPCLRPPIGSLQLGPTQLLGQQQPWPAPGDLQWQQLVVQTLKTLLWVHGATQPQQVFSPEQLSQLFTVHCRAGDVASAVALATGLNAGAQQVLLCPQALQLFAEAASAASASAPSPPHRSSQQQQAASSTEAARSFLTTCASPAALAAALRDASSCSGTASQLLAQAARPVLPAAQLEELLQGLQQVAVQRRLRQLQGC